MDVKLLTEFYLEFLSLNVGCIGLPGSTLVKMPQCWKSHVTAQLYKFTSPVYGFFSPVIAFVCCLLQAGDCHCVVYQCGSWLSLIHL